MAESNRVLSWLARAFATLLTSVLGSVCIAQQPSVEGLYLDLENISPNNVMGASQQLGGLFIQGGFVCAVSATLGVCNSGGGGPIGGYQTVTFNDPSPLPGSPFHQYSINAPAYSTSVTQNAYSIAIPSPPSPYQYYAPLTYASAGDQIGFTLATSSSYYNVSGRFTDGTSYPDLVGSPSNTPSWEYFVGDSATASSREYGQFLLANVNCLGQIQAVNLFNCNGQLAPVVPFPQNVNFSLTSQADNIITPTFSWTQASGYTPDEFRMEIWQINGSGAAATNIYSVSLPSNTTAYTVPSTFTNLTTGQPSSLQVGQEYAIDIENITLRNPAYNDAANDNVWSRSRSFFDFTPTMTTSSLPAGTAIAIPVVNNASGTTTYVFNQNVIAGSTTYIDPAMATGYVYQTGSGNPNFTSVTPISTIGSGLYQLYTQTAGGSYVFTTNIQAGQTYNFSGTGVSSFEILGIPASANIDPSNTSAFITGLTFAGSGQFTGTMTPVTATASVAGGASTDGPMPIWALAVLAAGFVRIASRRLTNVS